MAAGLLSRGRPSIRHSSCPLFSPTPMSSYNENRLIGPYGHPQARGGYQASAGMRGREFRNTGRTSAVTKESSQAPTRNVPDSKHQTSVQKPVEKADDVKSPEGANDVVIS